jgi:hypothetical protein
MIANFVAQDTNQPRALGGIPLEPIARFQRGKKSFLHDILCIVFVPQLTKSVIVKIVTVFIDPIDGI